MGTQTISQRERERREKQRREQAAAGRTIFGQADSPVDIPGYGEVMLTYTNRGLAWAERHLTPLMDDLPERLSGQWVTPGGDPAHPEADGAIFVPHDNCWDGLEALTRRYPMETMPVLLIAGTRHEDVSEDYLWDLPPSVCANEQFGEAVGQAVAAAFGNGLEEDDEDHPPVAAAAEGTPAE